MKSNLLFGLVIILLLVSGCVSSKLDTAVFGDDECPLPCWHGIIPVSTSKAEAMKVIRSIEPDMRISADESFIHFSPNDLARNRLHINSNEIVDWISLELEQAELGQIIDIVGEPDKLLFMIDSGGCIYYVFFPSKGVSLEGPCKTSITGKYWIISPNTKVKFAYFTEPSDKVDGAIVLLFGKDVYSRVKDATRTWDGYDKYSIYP